MLDLEGHGMGPKGRDLKRMERSMGRGRKQAQSKPKRFMYSLLRSHMWYACAVFGGFSVLLAVSFDPAGPAVEIELWQLLLLLGLLLLGGLLFSWRMAVRMTKPLRDMNLLLERMSGGHYGERIPLSEYQEWRDIQQQFNRMAASLACTLAENEKLQQSKRRMLSDLSHDLKTPITMIQGYAKALELNMTEDEETRGRYLKRIQNSSGYAAELIDQMFELTQLDRPGYVLGLEETDIAELLREIAADHYEAFESGGYALEADIPEQKVIVCCDPKLIRRAVSNLLTNAVKHNPPGISVAVRLRAEADRLQLEVSDNGAGIPAEWGDTLFEAFVRMDSSRHKEGAGLGLAIARQVADLHGGSLRLARPAGGAAFVLELPWAQRAAGAHSGLKGTQE